MDRIKLVFACDNRYYPGLAGTLTSLLLFSSSTEIDIYVIDGGISEKNKADLKKIVKLFSQNLKIIFIKPDLSSFSSFPAFFYDSMMTYARLLIPSLIDEKKVIYVDTDILFSKDIVELWNTPLNGKTAAAALDATFTQIGMDCTICEQLNIDANAPYFNAGLLVLDLESEKKNQVMQRTMSYLTTHPEQCKYWDQSALNAMLYNDFVLVDQSWNIQSKKTSFNIITDYNKILGDINHHFVSSYKPWLCYSESLPDRVFTCLLQHVCCEYENDSYKKTKTTYILKKIFSPIAPFYYNVRANLLFKIKGRNPDSDFQTADYWKEVNEEKENMNPIKANIDAVYNFWNLKISKVVNVGN